MDANSSAADFSVSRLILSHNPGLVFEWDAIKMFGIVRYENQIMTHRTASNKQIKIIYRQSHLRRFSFLTGIK